MPWMQFRKRIQRSQTLKRLLGSVHYSQNAADLHKVDGGLLATKFGQAAAKVNYKLHSHEPGGVSGK